MPMSDESKHISLEQHYKEEEELYARFGSSSDNETSDLEDLTSVEKLTEAVSRSGQYLSEEVAEELRALFSPATLATMVGVFAAYIAAHATGIGQAMDIGMLIAGGIFFGLDAFAIFKDIAGFAGAVNATTEEELDDAGQHLASAVAKIGVDALWTLLTKKVADRVADTGKTNEMYQPDLTRGDTPMSDELLESVKRKRDVVEVAPGSDEEAFLNWSNANASAGYSPNNLNPNNKDGILIRPGAKKIEIMEEFLHGTQANIGMDTSTGNIRNLEIHVKDFMIRHKDLLGLSDKDIEALTIMKQSYEQ